MSDFQEFVKALKRLEQRHSCFEMVMSFEEAITIIAQIQVALRHPGNVGNTSKQARELIEGMISHLEKQEPVLGPLLRKGFDPACDVSQSKSPQQQGESS